MRGRADPVLRAGVGCWIDGRQHLMQHDRFSLAWYAQPGLPGTSVCSWDMHQVFATEHQHNWPLESAFTIPQSLAAVGPRRPATKARRQPTTYHRLLPWPALTGVEKACPALGRRGSRPNGQTVLPVETRPGPETGANRRPGTRAAKPCHCWALTWLAFPAVLLLAETAQGRRPGRPGCAAIPATPATPRLLTPVMQNRLQGWCSSTTRSPGPQGKRLTLPRVGGQQQGVGLGGGHR